MAALQAQIAGVAASQLARVLQKHGERRVTDRVGQVCVTSLGDAFRHRRRRAVNTEVRSVFQTLEGFPTSISCLTSASDLHL